MTETATTVWIVGEMSDINDEFDAGWTLHGVFTDRNAAISACRDENYFVGPVPINIALPEDKIYWPGAFYPVAKGDQHD